MYIQTTKQENELEKILIVNDIVPNRLKIGYDWKIIFENKFEDIEDFELFCISVAKDIFIREFQDKEGFYKNIEEHTEDSNEEDSDEEDEEDEDSDEEDFDGFDFIYKGLEYLFNVIADKQLKNNKK